MRFPLAYLVVGHRDQQIEPIHQPNVIVISINYYLKLEYPPTELGNNILTLKLKLNCSINLQNKCHSGDRLKLSRYC